MLRHSTIAAVSIALSVPALANARSYRVTDLGPAGTLATGRLNDRGHFAAQDDRGSALSHVFITIGGVRHDCGPGEVDALNQRDQIAGAVTVLEPTFSIHAAVWDDCKRVDLSNTWNSRIVEAKGINNWGQVAGYYLTQAGDHFHAVVWEGGKAIELGGEESAAADINDFGIVAGYTVEPGAPFSHAVIWRWGEKIDLGALGDGASSAIAINDRMQVTGSSTPRVGLGHAFLWDNGVMTDLGSLGGVSQPSDLNELGQVVGQSTVSFPGDPNDSAHAVLWEGGQIFDLAALITEPGWTLDTAVGINDFGQIVCWGHHEGERRYVLLTPTR